MNKPDNGKQNNILNTSPCCFPPPPSPNKHIIKSIYLLNQHSALTHTSKNSRQTYNNNKKIKKTKQNNARKTKGAGHFVLIINAETHVLFTITVALAEELALFNRLQYSYRSEHDQIPFSTLTLDDRQGTPLCLLPARAKQPFLDLLHQLCQVLWVTLHDLVKLSKLSRPEEYLGQAKLEVLVIQSQSFEQ